MSKIKLCIFDMDGVLVDSETVFVINAKRCSEKYSYGITDELLQLTTGVNDAEAKRRFLEYMGEDFPYDEYCEREWQMQLQYMEENPFKLKKGVIELLDYLTANNINKVVATSTRRENATKRLKGVNIFDYFDSLVCGDDIRHSKPDPEIYQKAAALYDYSKDEILVFEDSNNGVLSGYNAGLNVVYVPDYAIVPEENIKKCYATVDNLLEVIGLIDNTH